MSDDAGQEIQKADLIGDDVAKDLADAMNDQMSGSATPATVVKPHGKPMSMDPLGPHTPAMPGGAGSPPSTSNNQPTNGLPMDNNMAPPGPPQPQDDGNDNDVPLPTPQLDTTSAMEPEEPEDQPETQKPEPTLGPDLAPKTDGADSDDLSQLKQDALTQLGPLVDHIDQDPEERYKTLMMMIRASDDESLIKPAYEAAQGITDQKKKAEALLDIINEINYLTRQQGPEPNQE